MPSTDNQYLFPSSKKLTHGVSFFDAYMGFERESNSGLHGALAALELQEQDDDEQRKACDVRQEAWLDHHEATRDEHEALHRAAVIGQVADEGRRERNHADEGRQGRQQQVKGRALNHQQHRRQDEHVRDDEGRYGKLRGVDACPQGIAARDA